MYHTVWVDRHVWYVCMYIIVVWKCKKIPHVQLFSFFLSYARLWWYLFTFFLDLDWDSEGNWLEISKTYIFFLIKKKKVYCFPHSLGRWQGLFWYDTIDEDRFGLDVCVCVWHRGVLVLVEVLYLRYDIAVFGKNNNLILTRASELYCLPSYFP